jgi:SAM-dependent methyltransferase
MSAALMEASGLASRVARRLLIQSKLLTRGQLLRALRSAVESVDPSPAAGSWTSYRQGTVREIGKPGWALPTGDARPAKIVELINLVKPRTVLDIGANDGYFSALAALSGAKVLAIDTDEGAIDKFNLWVIEREPATEALACVGSFHKVTQRADLVLGLALVHHLAISQQYKFDYIASRFAAMSRKALITEFMPNGLGGDQVQPDPLPAHYRLEIYMSELRKYFAQVDVIEYARPGSFSPRTLIFCNGR